MQGDVAVAALDSELVELYRARPELGNDGSLRDSDETNGKIIFLVILFHDLKILNLFI